MSIAQPATYRSPAGAYSLSSIPATAWPRQRRVPLLPEREEVWSGLREYTLRLVTVTDAGFVAGIAYRNVRGSAMARSSTPRIPAHRHPGLHRPGVLNEVLERSVRLRVDPPLPTLPYVKQFLSMPRMAAWCCGLTTTAAAGRLAHYSLPTGELLSRFRLEQRTAERRALDGWSTAA